MDKKILADFNVKFLKVLDAELKITPKDMKLHIDLVTEKGKHILKFTRVRKEETNLKKGRWSKEEIEKLYEMAINKNMTLEVICLELNRSLGSCKRVMEKLLGSEIDEYNYNHDTRKIWIDRGEKNE